MVNTDSREEVREFFNAVYASSEQAPQGSTADVSSCTPGHNQAGFQQAELRRINWFRALAGLPASIVLDPTDNWGSQQMAVMISANTALNHNPPPSYTCYNDTAAGYAGGNQALGADGAEATTLYIWDYGANNSEVGHRRWLLYPPETVMGIGDVPAAGSYGAANLSYVFDPANSGPRPATRQPFVAWPPAGFVPYQLVFPYWSFGLSNADLSAATIRMTSNGIPVSVSLQPYQTGYGDNTLVWVPMGLDGSSGGTSFPFNGSDTRYGITVSNILYNSTRFSCSYSVTVFDPAVPGADYVPATLSGPGLAEAGFPTLYAATPANNPHVTSYNFLTARLAAGDLFDDGGNGLANFTLTPPPNYSPNATQPFSSGPCFNLQHPGTNSFPQWLQFTELLLPTANTVLSFQSELGFATSDETARVQVSADGGANWQDLYTQAGNGSRETSFTGHTLPLAAYAGRTVQLRFNYDFQGGSYYNGGYPLGWFLTDILLTNTQALIDQTTNTSSVTNIVSGNLTDSANNGLANFTLTPPPYYYPVTNPPVGTEPHCFHLTHLDAASQLLQLNELLLPSVNSTLSFASQMGYATSYETGRVQVSTNGGASWDDLFAQSGSGSPEAAFTPHALSLAAYAGKLTTVRFNFDFPGGGYYAQSDNYIGWNLEDISLANVQQQAVTVLDTTNFAFTPAQPGTYLLQAQPVIFGQFALEAGPVKEVTAVSNPNPLILLAPPALANNQVVLNFTVSGNPASSFHLLQATALPHPSWSTNLTATLTTITPGSSYRFTVPKTAATEFYRVQTP